MHEFGWIRMALGVAVFILLMVAHEWVTGAIVTPWEGPVAPQG